MAQYDSRILRSYEFLPCATRSPRNIVALAFRRGPHKCFSPKTAKSAPKNIFLSQKLAYFKKAVPLQRQR